MIGDPPGATSGNLVASGRRDGSERRARTAPENADWFDATWNPTAGCSLVSPGCDHCYAMRIAAQLARMGGKTGTRYAGLTTTERFGPLWTGEMRLAQELLAWPLLRRRPRRIAVSLMSDLFHENLPTGSVDLVHAVMRAAHWHQFLLLTKRTERMRAYYSDPQTPRRIAETSNLLTSLILPNRRRPPRRAARTRPLPAPDAWPLPNLWPGVSVEDQHRMSRVCDLLQTPAAIRWVCLEPLLEQVRPDAVHIDGGYFDALRGTHYTIDGGGHTISLEGPDWPPLDWVVAGGEIGAGARPMRAGWLRELRDHCVSARIPFFFRQWGEWAPAHGSSAEEMTRVGKRLAGRMLDGRTWDQIPRPTPRG
jgi:protein gp37